MTAPLEDELFEIGDIVMHVDWDLCIWVIVEIESDSTVMGRMLHPFRACLELLGGHAMPTGWVTNPRFNLDRLRHVDNEMVILAMSGMDCRP